MRTDSITISVAQQRDIIKYANLAVAKFSKSRVNSIGFSPRFFTKEDLEDIVGNVIYKACRYFPSFDSSKSELINWVWRIAINCVIDAVDYKIKHRPISYSLYAENSESGEEFNMDEVCDERCGFNPEVWDMLSEYDADRDLNQKELFACMNGLCAKLSVKNQRYEKWLEEGTSPKEMAAMDGCTPNAVSKRIWVIRQTLSNPAAEIAKEFGIPFNFSKKIAG